MNQKGIIFIATVSALLACSARAADWPTFLGPKRDGISPDTGLLKTWPDAGPVQLWKNTNIGQGWSSVAVVGDLLYTTGNEGENQMLMCIDVKTGKEIYRNPFAANNTANTPTPAYSDGYLFWSVGYNKGSICLKVTNANGTWNFAEAWKSGEVGSHPGNFVVANGQIYGKGKRGLTCLDLKSGQILWSTPGYAGQATFADGMVYAFADQGGKLALVEPMAGEGRIKGKIQVEGTGSSWSHPVVINGRLFVRYDTNLYCFDVKQ
jgi:outer membrane protein assembly factor BamB